MEKNSNQYEFSIDFLNIAYLNKKNRRGKFENFVLVQEKLLSIKPEAKIFAVADPQAPFVIDNRKMYENLIKDGKIFQVAHGEKADYYLIRYAENKPNCFIITNDRFKDYEFDEDLQNRIIPVVIINDEVIFSQKLDMKEVRKNGKKEKI